MIVITIKRLVRKKNDMKNVEFFVNNHVNGSKITWKKEVEKSCNIHKFCALPRIGVSQKFSERLSKSGLTKIYSLHMLYVDKTTFTWSVLELIFCICAQDFAKQLSYVSIITLTDNLVFQNKF